MGQDQDGKPHFDYFLSKFKVFLNVKHTETRIINRFINIP